MTMYKDAYTTKELIAHLNLSQAKGVLAKAKREGWQSRPRKGRGGGNEWLVESMPKATRRAIAAGLLRMQDPDSGRVPAVPDAAGTGRRAGIASRLGNLSGLSKRQREVATARLAFVREVHRLMGVVGKEAAIQSLVSAAADGSLALHLQQLVSVANDKTGNGKAKRGISRRRLYAWCSDYERGGEEALAPKHRQPDYTVPDWAPLFLSFFQQPQKPSMVQAHKDLLAAYESGKLTGKAPSLDAVRRWAKKVALPELSRGRKTGNALLSMAPCKRRSTTHMLPTDCYTADGTTFDAEVRNPLNGRPFKPEVTLVLDVATRRCVGISLSMSENMQSVLDALRMACMFGGIPAMFYADNGPGYDNLQLSTEGTGILTRLGIERAASLPGRPQGKGLMERAVGTICEPVAKRLPSCTHSDMDKDAAKKVYKITREALKRKVQTAFLPSWEDFKELMLERVVEYNATPHRALPKITDETGRRRHMSPDECWEHHVQNGFEPVRVPEDMKDELFMPAERRFTRRGEVTFYGGTYYSEELAPYHGDAVMVRYDVWDASRVYIWTMDGRKICDALLDGNSTPYFQQSRIEAARERRAQQQLRRLERKAQAIDPAATLALPEAQHPVTIDLLADSLQRPEPVKAACSAEDPPITLHVVQKRPRFMHAYERYEWLMRNKDRWEANDEPWLMDYVESAEYAASHDRYEYEGIAWPHWAEPAAGNPR